MDRKEIVFLNEEIRTDFAKKNVYFSQFTEGVVKIQTNRSDLKAEDHICQAMAELKRLNPNLRLSGFSVISSSLGIDGAILNFEKK